MIAYYASSGMCYFCAMASGSREKIVKVLNFERPLMCVKMVGGCKKKCSQCRSPFRQESEYNTFRFFCYVTNTPGNVLFLYFSLPQFF